MTLTPEIIAKLIFHVSNLRYFEREHLADPIKDPETEKAIVILKKEIDTVLYEMCLDEHFALDQLTEIVKVYAESYSRKAINKVLPEVANS